MTLVIRSKSWKKTSRGIIGAQLGKLRGNHGNGDQNASYAILLGFQNAGKQPNGIRKPDCNSHIGNNGVAETLPDDDPQLLPTFPSVIFRP